MRLPWQRKPHEPYRWQELADYNSRVSKGIVHTPEYVARMADEQREFNLDQGYIERWDDKGDGIVGRSKYGWIAER